MSLKIQYQIITLFNFYNTNCNLLFRFSKALEACQMENSITDLCDVILHFISDNSFDNQFQGYLTYCRNHYFQKEIAADLEYILSF